MQRSYEENSSHPLRDARQGKDDPPDSAQRRLLPYLFDAATRSWNRELPES